MTDQHLSLQLGMQRHLCGPCSKEQGEKQCVSAVMLPGCSQGWSTSGTCTSVADAGINGSDSRILPFIFSLGRSDILQFIFGFSCCYLLPRGAQGNCFWSQQAGFAAHSQLSAAFQRQPAAPFGSPSAVLPSFHLQLFKTVAQITLASGQGKMLPAPAK